MAVVLLALCFEIRTSNLAFSSIMQRACSMCSVDLRKRNVTLNLSLISNYKIKGLDENP